MSPMAGRIGCAASLAGLLALSCQSSALDHLEAGRKALGRGQYRRAIALYTEVTLQAPGTLEAAQALYDTGVIYYLQLRDLSAARASFLKLLADYPRAPVARHARRMLARMYEQDLNAPERAIQEYEQLLADASSPAEERAVVLSIANCRYTLNQLQEAREDYRRLIEDFPYEESSDPAYLRLAHIERLSGRDEESLRVLAELLEKSERSESRLRAFLARVQLLLDLRRFSQAQSELSQARREFPGQPALAQLADRGKEQQNEQRSLDDGARESRELLEELQKKIRWGRVRESAAAARRKGGKHD